MKPAKPQKKILAGRYGEYEQLILLCIEFKTLLPLLPLSWYDFIYLTEFLKEDARSRDLINQDIRSATIRLLDISGGNSENLPSDLYRMAKRYEKLTN